MKEFSSPRRGLAVLAVLAALVLAAGSFALGSVIRSNSLAAIRANQAAEHAATYGTCHRNNLGRIAQNRNTYSQFRVSAAEATLLTFIRQSSTGTPTPARKRASILFDAVVAAIRQGLAAEAWLPLANCEEAVDHPLGYVPPAAVTFVSRAPPATAFTIGPDE